MAGEQHLNERQDEAVRHVFEAIREGFSGGGR